MNKEEIKKINIIVTLEKELEYISNHLEQIENHRFGFGTSFRRFDNFLRPLAKEYLLAQKEIIERKLISLIK